METEASPPPAPVRLSQAGRNRFIRAPDAAEPALVLRPLGPPTMPESARVQTKRKPDFYDGTDPSTYSLPRKVANPVLLADADGRFLKLDGLSIHYKLTEKPSADALTLVLMHGFSGNITNFNNVWEALARDHQLLAFDRPGWGLSARVARDTEHNTWPTTSGENPYTYEVRACVCVCVLP